MAAAPGLLAGRGAFPQGKRFWWQDFDDCGYNFRMTDAQGAVGVVQLRKLDALNQRRIDNAAYLTAGLREVPGLTLPTVAPGCTHVFHLYPVQIEPGQFGMDKDDFIYTMLHERGIKVGTHYTPLHYTTAFQSAGVPERQFPGGGVAQRLVTLPLNPRQTHGGTRLPHRKRPGIAPWVIQTLAQRASLGGRASPRALISCVSWEVRARGDARPPGWRAGPARPNLPMGVNAAPITAPLKSLSPAQAAWRWRVMLATYIGYGGFYLTRKTFTICKTTIAKDLGWELGDTAHIWTAFLVAYMIGMFLNSFIGRRWGPRVLLLGGLGLSSRSTSYSGLPTHSPRSWSSCFNGLVQAAGWPGSVGSVSEWLRPAERGRIMGVWSTNYLFGNMIIKSLGGYLLGAQGWRWSFWGCTLQRSRCGGSCLSGNATGPRTCASNQSLTGSQPRGTP